MWRIGFSKIHWLRRLAGLLRNLCLTLCVMCFISYAHAEEPPPSDQPAKTALPEPLSLEFLLQLDVSGHPALQRAIASRALKKANQEAAESKYDFSANLLLQARVIEPSPIAYDQSRNDSQMHLSVTKRLYDFGRTNAAEEAALADVEGSELLYTDTLNRHRIEIISSYLAVLLADIRYARDNEAMATGYVQFDRARQRNKLGQVSDVEMLKLENQFQVLRRAYFHSQAEQRNTRARLANAVDRPGELVATLIEPELKVPLDKLPEYEELRDRALASNPVLAALRLQVSAAEERVREARSDGKPVIEGEARVSEYAREMGSYDKWRIGIVVDVPLITSDSVKASVARRNAELIDLRARLRDTEMAVSQQLLESWQALQSLKVGREQTDIQQQYRELYLDRSRTLYQMEAQADLGDAMVEITEARLQKSMVEYQLAIEWAKIQALTGQQVNVLQEQSNETAQ